MSRKQMTNISRRNFLKQVAAAGTGAAIFSPDLFAEDENVPSGVNNSPLLLVAPCLVRPTSSSVTVNIVSGNSPMECFIDCRESDSDNPWTKTDVFPAQRYTPVSVQMSSLKAGKLYEYRLHTRLEGSKAFETETRGTFRTQRTDKSAYSFALISDSHITPNKPERLKILSDISRSILARKPDFLMMLGDNIATFTSHGGPMTEERFGPVLYYMLRHGLGNLPASVPVFNVIGNWEGENGWHSEEYRSWARDARMSWLPGPLPGTYPEGGSIYSDYYGFTWGDTLNLVLNVTGYTSIEHIHGSKTGKGDDWTLGSRQKEWLYKQLSGSNHKWKFIYMHHTVAGKAGDDLNTRYGRGGGQAAYTGEQKIIHEWMKEFGVNPLFYGHDHVFTDIPVDGIHYVCVGSAGAPWKFTTEETGYKKYIPDSGYTWVDVYDHKLTVSFVRPDKLKAEGEVLHKFEIS